VLRRRLLWLLLFGVLHGALIWFGDILLLYALAGLVMMRFRSWRPGRLVAVGAVLVLLSTLLLVGSEIALQFARRTSRPTRGARPPRSRSRSLATETASRLPAREPEDLGHAVLDGSHRLRADDRGADDVGPGALQAGRAAGPRSHADLSADGRRGRAGAGADRLERPGPDPRRLPHGHARHGRAAQLHLGRRRDAGLHRPGQSGASRRLLRRCSWPWRRWVGWPSPTTSPRA
jgi:hypothetical protein